MRTTRSEWSQCWELTTLLKAVSSERRFGACFTDVSFTRTPQKTFSPTVIDVCETSPSGLEGGWYQLPAASSSLREPVQRDDRSVYKLNRRGGSRTAIDM
ncbi:hypothetical protein F2P81_002494 [Scophthalmus maximus]|uniref:Uncharacterized protein n=1 Tax=Scophthalmus maximus TaxID=52904 RepID=A0A6A4TL53_SCOMX|nr:hypothetical protein F2P81_002494 [Scophthalmus maximus]